jgi:diguanylate cyclase (GGDEF)-like protein/PAS domain S-box-containing protein
VSALSNRAVAASDAWFRTARALTAEETLHLIERTAHIGTYDFDIRADKRTWSDELYRILGLPVGGAVDGTSYVQRVHPDDLDVVLAHRAALRQGIPFRHEHRVVHDDGSERWVETSMQPVLDLHGSVVRLFGTGVDVTKRKLAELQLAFLAQHDVLTGLPNRALLAEKLATATSEAARSGRHVAVVYVDLDDFKRINDTYGHAEGDRVIRRCAESLTACMRAGDVVARVGGDEFVVILADMESNAVATRAVERMRTVLAEPMTVGTVTMRLRASFGISCFPADGDSADQLIRYADLAMYQAKNAQRGDFAYFEPALLDAALERLRLEHALGEAIAHGDLIVHYQPIIDACTRRIGGVEALVRWPGPSGVLISPDSFIPLAEETGLIVPLGDFVLREATRTVAELQQSGYPDLRLSVNLSVRQLDDDALPATVRAALARSGMRPNLLDLEITETYLTSDPVRAAKQLGELTRLGIRIAVDNFGTGYSALSFVRRFPADLLKLDRSFVGEIERNPASRAVAGSIIELARKLGMRSVAEGVETADQHRVLDELGCDAFQGFYFAPAMTADELRHYLAAGGGAGVTSSEAAPARPARP